MILRRRQPGDTADLAHLEAELDHERKHSAALARANADLHELNRHLVEGRDHWRGEARRHLADLTNLRAEMRGRAS